MRCKGQNRTIEKLRIYLVSVLCSLAFISIAVPSALGNLDLTFGNSGRVTDWAGWIFEVAIQPDGKIVAAGVNPPFSWSGPRPNHNILVARYDRDGSPDTTFGSGSGKVVIDSGNPDWVTGIAILADGKILLTGRFENVGAVLVRLNANGSRDTTFGSNGVVVTANCNPSSLALQPDGKIVVSHFNVGACRFNPDGSPDTTFGTGGFVSTPIGPVGWYRYAFSMVIQPDGKIVLAGGVSVEGEAPAYFGLVRYNPNGSLDTSFGETGIVLTGPSNENYLANSVRIQPDGKLVAVGDSQMVRYNVDGSLDTGFGSAGIVSGLPVNSVSGVVVQSNGKILVSGIDQSIFEWDFAIARFNPNGSLDTSFGGGDAITTLDFNQNSNDISSAIVLDNQGRAVIVGQADETFALARFRPGPYSTPFDYDGDGRTDISVYRPANGSWYVARSLTGDMSVQTFWSYGVFAADYDGDGKTDPATPDLDIDNNSILIFLSSSTNTVQVRNFFFGDRGVVADFDGDGKADPGVWTEGLWRIALSQGGTVYTHQWGVAGDRPVPADFDGDGRAELAVWRPSIGRWYVANIWAGTISTVNWGVDGDIPVAGDYSGDGRSDYAVYRPSNNIWYRLHSDDFSIHKTAWGLPNDIVTPGDYDSDGKTDVAVFRPFNGTWYIVQSSGGTRYVQFGQNGDTPTPSAFIY